VELFLSATLKKVWHVISIVDKMEILDTVVHQAEWMSMQPFACDP